MKGKVMLLAGGAIGYVLGTKAGRERYEQIRTQAQSLWQNPKVQQKAQQAQDFAKEKAPIVKDKMADTASSSSDTTASETVVASPAGESPAYPNASTTSGLS